MTLVISHACIHAAIHKVLQKHLSREIDDFWYFLVSYRSKFIEVCMCANNRLNINSFDKVIANIKRLQFFASLCSTCEHVVGSSGRRTAGVTAASTGAFAVNGSPGTAVVNSRPMAGPPGPSPQRSPQSFTRPVADNVDRLVRWLLLMRVAASTTGADGQRRRQR